jgi:hypothetical protein
MRSLLRRIYWWVMRRVNVSARPGGVPLIYVSALHDRSTGEIAAMLGGALSLLDEHAPSEAARIRRTVRFIAAVNTPYSYALPDVGGYVTSFSDAEMRGAPLLACKLVWASTFLETLTTQETELGEVDRDVARAAADTRARTLLTSLPDGGNWLAYWPSLYGNVH